jgi:hypothetical protein
MQTHLWIWLECLNVPTYRDQEDVVSLFCTIIMVLAICFLLKSINKSRLGLSTEMLDSNNDAHLVTGNSGNVLPI